MTIVGKSDGEIMGQRQAYFANSWLLINNGMRSLQPGSSLSADFTGIIEATSRTFDGNFQKKVEQLNIGYLSSNSMTEALDITDLNFYPIKYAKVRVEYTLRARGRIFWNCRAKTYVQYSGKVHTDTARTAVRIYPVRQEVILYKKLTEIDCIKVHNRYCHLQSDASKCV